MRFLVETGFFSNGPVHVALALSAAVSLLSGTVGVLTVVRAQAFAGHALTDVATTGGSFASLVNVSPLGGFLGASVVGGGVMELIGVERVRGRDVATGMVLGVATSMSALFLYLDSTRTATTGVTQQILFGSVFTVASDTIPIVVVVSVLSLAWLAASYRSLLLASVAPDIARARGIHVRALSAGFLTSMALAVGLSSLTVGSILSTALLIGPAASAVRFTRSIPRAMALAVGFSVVCSWLGILASYDSFYWEASQRSLPVSFFIVVAICVVYLVARLVPQERSRDSSTSRG